MQPNPLQRRFLDRFPQEERSTVANRFLGVVRRAEQPLTPDEVLAGVREETKRHLADAFRYGTASPWGTQAQEKTLRLLIALTRYADDARSYAAWCIAYESLPYEERQELKARHMAEGRAAVQTAKLPSTPQLTYITRLGGDANSVQTMAEASALIDRLLREQRDGRA